jgi:hypothetical protein
LKFFDQDQCTLQAQASVQVAEASTEASVKISSEDVLSAQTVDVEGELQKLEENMLASLRRRRKLMKKIGIWQQMVTIPSMTVFNSSLSL